MKRMCENDLGYNILNILQDPFVEKLYISNRYIVNVLLKYVWSHDLFRKYEPHELRRELVTSCVSGRYWLFVGSGTHDVARSFPLN